MTREEAVRMIVGKIRDHEENGHCAFFDEDDEIEALRMALYALRDNPPIDKVLEIIDEIEHDTGHVALIGVDNKFAGVLCNSSEFRDRVLALKEGEQE